MNAFAKLRSIVREMGHLILKHKAYFLLPILLALAALALLAYHVGPAVAISFIYAGL